MRATTENSTPSVLEIIAYGAWIGALCATGLLCFWLVPTAVPRPELPPELVQRIGHVALYYRRNPDKPGILLPD